MSRKNYTRLLGGAAAIALASGGAAWAEDANFNIAPQPLSTALNAFSEQSAHPVLFKSDMALNKTTAGVTGAADSEVALAQLLQGTGLGYRRAGDTFVIVQAGEGGSPQGGSAAGGGATVEALIVTAQKREEDIQDVPIAISAFSQKSLDEMKIEGGFDLLKAIPNVTFSKTNFTSYNFSIRGVGTKAISATTDPGVAVAFNNTTLIQNRLFEQEYFDVERVEVLRGPQGTLYGRNATSGVINVISAKPELNKFDGWIKGEVGNFHAKRASAMVNVPIVQDVLALRVAGAFTDRDGYDYNSVTKHAVNGRDLWSARVTLGFEPTERLRGNLTWERFEEDDDRSRTGKQLCHRDDGPEYIGDTQLIRPDHTSFGDIHFIRPSLFSQGCKPGSLYDDAAFGTPNGLALPFVFTAQIGPLLGSIGYVGDDPSVSDFLGRRMSIVPRGVDPYGGMMQSRDLRTIASYRDPVYRAKADLLDLNFEFDLTDNLTFVSQTVYNEDQVYSFQDFNRFNTVPIFTDTSNLVMMDSSTFEEIPSDKRNIAPGGIFCDPQIGCSNTLAGFDISQAEGKQFSQEFRISSDFEGPVNFSAGANYTRFETLNDYYVFYNLISVLAMTGMFNATQDPLTHCHAITIPSPPTLTPTIGYPVPDPRALCPYVDPTPIDTSQNFDGDGHNYFRSKNPYKLKSKAAFGEMYWNMTEAVKLTAGLRYTEDTKTFIPVPSQVLLAQGPIGGGTVNRGYPEKPAIVQEWGEWTGRLGVDWKPLLPFTDETMVYAFYSRGYKGGGANPPSPGFATADEYDAILESYGTTAFIHAAPLTLNAVEYGPTFDPEFVNAFEVGAKNTLLDGAMSFNATAFYYDYKDYQVSQIRDRTAVNENFDATIWGLEFETVFAPSRDLRVNWNLGYLDTEIADGESSIDIMNRTQGNPDYVLAKPWVQLPSNCVLPTSVAEQWAQANNGVQQFASLCGGLSFNSAAFLFGLGRRWDLEDYPELNGGAGIRDELGGNELPNAPHWTSNLGIQYGHDLGESWRVTLRGDAYWQSQSWARVYNAVNDKLHGWYNANLSVWIERPDDGLRIELYAKNILDDTPITDAFLNSDDTALTTNVFVLDPRLIGLSIRKEF